MLDVFSAGSVVKNPPVNARDAGEMGSIAGLGRSPRGRRGNPFQYSCLGNHMDRETWWATVNGVVKESDTTKQLNNDNLLPGLFFCLFLSNICI